MKKKVSNPKVEQKKVILIGLLFGTSVAIILLGAVIGIMSYINNINIAILTSQVPCALLGLVIMFLGVRYFLSVQKLKQEVYQSDVTFSWNNFKIKSKN